MIADLTPSEQEEVLQKKIHGHLGCHADGETYVVPILYAYANKTVYFHTYEGKKAEIIRKNPRVCFQVDDGTDLHKWRSVVAWGECEELKGKDVTDAIQFLSEKAARAITGSMRGLRRKKDPSHLLRLNHKKVILYRIRFTKMTGRSEQS